MSDARPPQPSLPPPTPARGAPLPPPTLTAPPAPPPPPSESPGAPTLPLAGPSTSPPVPTLPTVPVPAAHAERPTPAGRLPQSTIDALRAGVPGEQRQPRRQAPWIFRFLFSRATLVLALLAIGGVGSALEYFGVTSFSEERDPRVQQWDPRVEPIAAFVENERGLTFDYPVYVNFLTEQEYVDLFTGDAAWEPDQATIDYYADLSALYDAAGLATDLDLLASENTVFSVSTLGFYSFDTDTIFIRGNELTPDVKAVLAHELVHALQAQHFDIALGGQNDLALRSIVEADALRVEDVYISTLSEADQETVRVALTADASDDAALSDVPVALVEQNIAPYVLGPQLLESVFADRGNAGVDALIETPPTEEILVDPTLFGTGQRDAVITVDVPEGATVIEESQPLSMIDMLAMLDAWLPWRDARGALDDWNGGGYASYVTSEGVACFSVDASFDTTPDRFFDAVVAWAAASQSSATPQIDGQRVLFEACERTESATTPPTPVITMTTAIFYEHSAVSELPAGTPDEEVDAWRCVVRTMVDHPEAAPLLMQPEWSADDEAAYDSILTSVYPSCGVPAVPD